MVLNKSRCSKGLVFSSEQAACFLSYVFEVDDELSATVAVLEMRVLIKIISRFKERWQHPLKFFTNLVIGYEFRRHGPTHSPAIVIPSIRIVGDATDPRNTRSFPIAATFISISPRLPAIVISSTACVSCPFSIHNPAAPRE